MLLTDDASLYVLGGLDAGKSSTAAVVRIVSATRSSATTRLIVRREPLHPGAQQTLFPSTMYRYWGHYTDADGDPVALDP